MPDVQPAAAKTPPMRAPSPATPQKTSAPAQQMSATPRPASASGESKAGQAPQTSEAMRPRPWWLTFLAVLAINYLLITMFAPGQPQRMDVSYTEFKQQVEAGNVAEVTSRGDTIQGTFKQAMTHPAQGNTPAQTMTEFSTVQPAFADPGLETLLNQQGVIINARPLDEPRSWWLTLLISFGPTLLLIGGFLWLSSKMGGAMSGGGVFGMGRSKARRYDQTESGASAVTFADVAGIDEARQELVEIVDFLKDPQKYTRLGGAVPKGVLLIGAPGTGKTLLARAVAGEAGVPFFSMGASEFVEMIVGVGASRVRDLFKQAREAAPAIIFIDELDAIGHARGAGILTGSNSEQEQTLNQILTEMDGFSSREGVIVLAATNRPDVLDAALLRPGRFDRRVTIQSPDKPGRLAILKVHTRGVPLANDVVLGEVAGSTPGLVGADLRNLVNEAALLAARRGQNAVSQRDFMDALEKLALGPARHVILSAEERERVAYHEGGHTLLGLLVPGSDPVNRVTIIPRGMALGVTYQRPEDDRHNYSEEYLRARITGAMGGRAAEEVVYSGRTTGAENDLQQAAELARQMVTRWGMSDRLGPVSLFARDNPFLDGRDGLGIGASKPYSEATAQLVDTEIQRILEDSYAQAVKVLGAHRRELDALAEALLDHETLDEQDIRRVTGLPSAPREIAASVAIRRAAFNGRDVLDVRP